MTFFDRGEEMVFEDAFQLNTLWPNLIFGPQSPFKWKCSPSCALGTKPGVWPPCAVSLCSPPEAFFSARLFAELVSQLPGKVRKRSPFFYAWSALCKILSFSRWSKWMNWGGSTSLLNTVSGIRAELAKNAKTPWSGSCLERKKCVTNCCSRALLFFWPLRSSAATSWWSHCWKLRFPSLNLGYRITLLERMKQHKAFRIIVMQAMKNCQIIGIFSVITF